MASPFRFHDIEIDFKAIQGFMRTEEMEELLEEYGKEIERDVSTKDPDGEYDHVVAKNRKTRYVVHVRSVGEGAFFREAANGYLAKAGRKKRS